MGDIGRSTQLRAVHSRDDAASWLAGVIEGLGIDRAVFVGSSFGGFQPVNLAVRRPDLVGGLVLLGPAATVKPIKLALMLMIRAGSLVPMPFTVRPGLRSLMDGGLPDERIVRQMKLGVAGFRYDRRGVFPSEIPDGELAAITAPTLLMVGNHERIYDANEAIARARRLLPDVVTVLLPGVGHLPGLQVPDLVNQTVEQFLEARVAITDPQVPPGVD